jgi:hypothetical protein
MTTRSPEPTPLDDVPVPLPAAVGDAAGETVRGVDVELGRYDRRLVSAMVAVGLSGAAMAITAAFLWGNRMAISVSTGATIAASNLYVLARIVHALLDGNRDGSGGSNAGGWGVIAVTKMFFLFGGIWWVMTRGLVDPIGLVVGYGSLPIGIAIGAIVSDKAP